MAKISMAELASAAKEMNSVMGLQPKIKTVGIPEKALTEAIKLNAEEIDPETDEFTEETIDTLKALGAWPGEDVEDDTDPEDEIEEAENEDVVVKMRAEKEKGKKQPAASKAPVKGKKKPEPEPDPEEEEIEDGVEVEDLPLEDRLQTAKKMDDLKAIIDDFPEVFTKKVIKGFAEAKNPIMLKKAMKEAAGIVPAEKVEKVKKEKAEKGERMTKPVAVGLALQQGPKTIDEWVKWSDDLRVKSGSPSNLKEQRAYVGYLIPVFDMFGVNCPKN